MVPRHSVLLDLNIVLDVLQQREPFYEASACVLACAEKGWIEGWVAAHSITTLFRLMARYQSAERARIAIGDLLSLVSIAPVDQKVIERALALPYQDFEDAVQMAAAIRAGTHYLVTRNAQDFKAGPLPVLAPAELCALVQAQT
jgi:predicted nucleic acid-binding protein